MDRTFLVFIFYALIGIVLNRPVSSSLLPTTNECGLSTDDKIYGGSKAKLDDFPWMALIEYQRPDGQSDFNCGGALINRKYVLTAAHCLKGKDLPKDWKVISVRLGEYDTDTDIDCIPSLLGEQCAPPAIDVPVQEWVAHEQYNPFDLNQYHDIGLLRLAREITVTDYVRPICLPRSEQLLQRSYARKNLMVAGWGKTQNMSESNVKLKLEVPVNTSEECDRTYRQAGVSLIKGQLCAGGKKGEDSCRGDSGGPLMSLDSENGEINWYSVGIVSFGPTPCGMANWPAVYTRVSTYVDWIVRNLKP
ncbi:serine protease easter-like isoform X2 [Cylas formicarius]|uniref:serine protease easter-like isoform X2 n=1 Tax=Cylas formicarius TaxID=197179 RepID=UPI0029585FC4|nr:serine protease easter-like isoform X2 [Cylas formicarius]